MKGEMKSVRLWMLSTVCFASCAEVTFSSHARDNSADDIRRAVASSHGGVTAGQAGKVAYLVSGGAGRERLLLETLRFLRLSYVHRARDDLRPVVLFEPADHHRGIQPPGICDYDLLDCHKMGSF